MTLNELLQRLSYGPLSNLAISNEGDGTITAGKIPAIVGYANEALLRLHSKFILAEKELILEQDEAITRYTISSTNAVSYLVTDPASPGYIRDTEAEPYTDDLIKILGVYDGDGCALPLNDQKQTTGVFTPSYNILQVPVPIQGEPLFIMYQAKHPLLVPGTLTDPIILPEVLDEALIAYVAHKVFSHMNGQEHTAKAGDHLSRYIDVCAEVLDKDLVNSSVSTTLPKFDQRGFR